ncbi:MAG: tautomerase family protein [Anaerolineae bacterium]|nr:tautomerase family protein [Anaerolineae bacterium]
MAQVNIYGHRAHIDQHRSQLSDIIHSCLVDTFAIPQEKRFQRFFALDAADFIYPPERSEQYIIIEISMFEGRSVASKKTLFRLLFERLHEQLHISPQDVEITITETPRHNWGIRGLPGDELQLNYKVDID